MRKLSRIGRGVFGIALLSVLSFGGVSVLAVPSEAAESKGQCRPRACNDACKASGAQYGVCNYMDMSCDCIY